KKDRTFYFLNYEGLRVRQALTQTFSVPTLQVRSGNFAGLPTIYNPLSTDSSGKRLAFSDNVIPSNMIDPAAKAFLQKLPLPNLPGQVQNYLATPTLQNGYDQGVARLDHRINDKDSLFGRVYIANFDTFQPFGSSLLNESLVPGFGYF